MRKYHYVYKIINSNPQDERKYYIGVRSCDCLPEEDTQYMSSSKYLKEAISEQGQENFKKEILSIWETREEANLEEIRLHNEFDVGVNLEYYNKYNSRSDGYCVYGYVTVRDLRNGNCLNVLKEEYVTCDFYESITSNKVVVIDKFGIKKQISTKEYKNNKLNYSTPNTNKVVVVDKETSETISIQKSEFYMNRDKYQQISEGKVTVYDKNTKETKKITTEEFYNDNDRYNGTTSGQVTVKNLKTGEIKNVLKSEFENSNDLITVNTNIIKFYNMDGEFQFSNNCQIDKFLKSKNMPIYAFKNSFRNGGKPLYMEETNKSNWTNIKNKGYDVYKGWYAIKIN